MVCRRAASVSRKWSPWSVWARRAFWRRQRAERVRTPSWRRTRRGTCSCPCAGVGQQGGSLVLPLHKAPPMTKRGWDFRSSLCRLIRQFVGLKCWRTTAGKHVQAWGMTRVHASVSSWLTQGHYPGPESPLTPQRQGTQCPPRSQLWSPGRTTPRGPYSGFLDADFPSTWLSILAFCLFYN